MKNTALITGASGGIGMELAKIHASKKGDLVLVARGEKQLAELKAELEGKYGVTVRIFALDLNEDHAPQMIHETLQSEGIEVEILINNAGIGDYGTFWTADFGKIDAMVQLNVSVLTQMTHLFLPAMVERGHGRIMNVASTAAFMPGPLMATYYASKNYVLAFSEGIANELKGTGVSMTALCPGATATGFQSTAKLENSKLIKNAKIATAEEVAIYGYAAMQRGKVVAIPGLKNRINAALPRFIPRSMVPGIVRKVQEPAR